MINKKVLLRKRKRHTARRVASTRYAGRGYPPILGPNLDRGRPFPRPLAPCLDLGRGYPPWPKCELTHKLKILPSPILWMRAVNMERAEIEGK